MYTFRKKIIYLLLTIYIYTVVLFIVSCNSKIKNQTYQKQYNTSYTEENYFRLMFYNCENFYDCRHDTLKNDYEFLPVGAKYWTPDKYFKKRNQIAKVITAIGGWKAPEIVGLCEIENLSVLENLVNFSPIKNYQYKIIHKESPDLRGVDVALLYQNESFFPLKYLPISVIYPEKKSKRTRDILYVKGTTKTKDTLHIFINHWPSRFEGQLESEDNRIFVASLLRKHVDSIFVENQTANIIIMGDLNDFPENKSVLEYLKANTKFDKIISNQLYNLTAYLHDTKGLWTHKFQGESGTLDQIIISGNLFNKQNKIFTTTENVYIFNQAFLLEPDDTYLGHKPYRTYNGYKYLGGFSDHLPVYLDLIMN